MESTSTKPDSDGWSSYSLAERDRRWNAVRERGRAAGLDCVFVPLGAGLDSCYLTQLRGSVQTSCIAIPTDGGAPIVVTDRGSNDWVPDPRHCRRDFAEPVAQALVDAVQPNARIGVVGLHGGLVTHVRVPDGVVNDTAFAAAMLRLPNATFEDATDLLGFVRFVKSDEEFAALRRAVGIAEAGIEVLVQAARPGMEVAILYAHAFERMLAMGSHYYPLTLTIGSHAHSQSQRYVDVPRGVGLAEGSVIGAEVSAVWDWQLAEEVQPIVLGPMPESWKPVVDLQREAFETGLAHMRPGTTFGELIDAVNRLGRSGMTVEAVLYGCGYGDDGPLVIGDAFRPEARDLHIEAGNAFVWKPTVISADGRVRYACGGAIAVTPNGAERLGKRDHGPVSIT
ncbi:MAG: Xaa-Pro dipeptidase [Chloroflexota bacterium]|jgi:Xaa-Pro aminopeptidase|nr:Xaa-Pro dipeptidase [Chloroflexota bacterium]